MTTLGNIASLIRSKNAGPFELTVDVMFEDASSFEHVVASGAINAAAMSSLLGVPEDQVRIYTYAPALAIKVTVPRTVSAGDPADRDLFGGQLFGPLVNLEIR